MNAAVFTIWRQALLERRVRGSLGLSWVLLGLFALGLASAAMPTPQRGVLFAALAGVPMGALLVMWWIFLCANARAQCHPAALQLVPQLRQRVVRALVLAWLAIVAVMTVLAGVPTGYAPQVAIVTALVLIEASFIGSARGVAIGVLLVMLPNAPVALLAWLHGILMTPAALAAGALVVAVDGAVALRRMTRAPGAPPRMAGMAALLEQRARGPGGRPAGRFERAADAQPAYLQPLGRSWLGGHWPMVATVLLACMALRGWNAFQGPADAQAALAASRTILTIVLFGVLAMLVYLEAQRFASARAEQALLSLTPAAPRGPAMNRALAAQMAGGFVRTWSSMWLLSLAAMATLGASLPALACLCTVWAAALSLLALPLRDFARAGGDPGVGAVVLACLLAGAGAAAINGLGAPGFWLALAAAGLLAGGGLVYWRWRAMLAAAPALPAGRVQDKSSVRSATNSGTASSFP